MEAFFVGQPVGYKSVIVGHRIEKEGVAYVSVPPLAEEYWESHSGLWKNIAYCLFIF